MNDFEMFQGDYKVFAGQVTDPAGSPVDLTGFTAVRWQMSKSASKRPPQLEKSIGDGVVITSAVDGEFEVTLDSADTEDLKGDFYHEVEVKDASGRPATVLSGTITILPALIKP